MYQTLADFLAALSVDSPLWWALLVMAVIALTGLLLHLFWQLLLRAAGRALRRRSPSGTAPDPEPGDP